MQNYEKEKLFDKLDTLERHINELNLKQDKNLNIDLEKDKSDSKEVYFMDVKEKKDIIFSLVITKYDEYDFKQNVHQPFQWDNNMREKYAQEQWDDFLSSNDIDSDCPIQINLYINDMEVKDQKTVNRTLESISFYSFINDVSEELLNKSIKRNISLNNPLKEIQPTQEELAVEHVITRVNKIK